MNLKKILILCVYLVLISTNLLAQKKLIKLAEKDLVNFNAKEMLSLNRIGEMSISPDGKWILYSMSKPDISKNKSYKNLYVVSIDGTNTKQITEGTYSDFNPVWSPDGSKIAFISTRMGSPQIFTMNFPDGKPQGLTAFKDGVENLKWSPDGKYLSFSYEIKMMDNMNDKYPEYKLAQVYSYDKLPVRHWDSWEDNKRNHIFYMNATGGKEKDILSKENVDAPLKPFGGAEQYNWSPDANEITYTSNKEGNVATSTNSDLFIYNIASGDVKNITKGLLGADRNPLYSPDGKYIAFISLERPGFESDKSRVMLYNRTTGEINELTKSLDQWVEQMIWAPDSKSMYLTVSDHGREPIYQMNLDGTFKRLTTGDYNDASGLDITKDGSTLVFGRTSMTIPTEFYTIPTSGGEPFRITGVNDLNLIRYRDTKVEERWIESTDGAKVQTWIIYPPNFDPAKKYPMITYLQGGPQGMISHYFSYRWNFYLMASQGYVVVAANRRGVPGFGQKWCDAISKDWGGQAMSDYLAVTDVMSKEPYVDVNRRAAVGASAGGYAAFWMAGNAGDRFSALISHCGVFNFESMYGSTEEVFFPDWENGGPYWYEKNKPYYEKHSPSSYVNNWKTPIMIITGLNDFRVPYTQSLEAYTAAQLKGIPSKLLAFPTENHWVLGLQNSMIWHNEFYDFLDKYCKSKR